MLISLVAAIVYNSQYIPFLCSFKSSCLLLSHAQSAGYGMYKRTITTIYENAVYLKLARWMSRLSFQGQVLNWKWEPGETFPKEKNE